MKHDANKNPKGKLYAKYYNSLRLLKTTGLVATKPTTKTQEKYSGRNRCVQSLVRLYSTFFIGS